MVWLWIIRVGHWLNFFIFCFWFSFNYSHLFSLLSFFRYIVLFVNFPSHLWYWFFCSSGVLFFYYFPIHLSRILLFFFPFFSILSILFLFTVYCSHRKHSWNLISVKSWPWKLKMVCGNVFQWQSNVLIETWINIIVYRKGWG